MILVVVGTHFRGFDRLVMEMDEIAGEITTGEEVIMQIGVGGYEPRNSSRYFRNAPYPTMKALIEEARIVVCHAGSGSVLDCVGSGKVPIVVPRLARFGEARDDHQLELARFLAEDGSAVVVGEVERLREAIHEYGERGEPPQDLEERRKRKKLVDGARRGGTLPAVLKTFIDGLSATETSPTTKKKSAERT